jgi:hypothetical protein
LSWRVVSLTMRFCFLHSLSACAARIGSTSA